MSFLVPLLVSWGGGVALLAADGQRRWVGCLAAVTLAGVLGADLYALAEVSGGAPLELVTGGWPAGVGIRLRADSMSLFFAVISSGVLLAVMLHELSCEIRSRLFPALLLLLAAGLHGAFFTRDLFNLYVFFELAIIASFVLAASGYGRAEIRGTFVYVAVNLLGTVVFLSGVVASYHAFGTLDMDQIAARAPQSPGAATLLSGSLLFAAMSLKLGMFPFHYWLPVLYSHAQPPVAAAMTGALTNLGLYSLIRLGFSVFPAGRREAAEILLLLGAASILYGAILAAARRSRARIAAYAAVVHAGYIVLALGLGGEAGVAAALLTGLAGSMDKTALFLSLEAGGPVRRAAVLVASGSVAGLPVTAGFVAKLLLFRAALERAGGWGWVAALALVGSAVLLLAGSFRFWILTARRAAPGRERPTSLFVASLAAALLLFGLIPGPVVSFAESTGLAITGGAP